MEPNAVEPMMDTDRVLSSPGKQKSQPLQWRLQYGKRPPRKTLEQLEQEKAMVEAFLSTQLPTASSPEPKEAITPRASATKQLSAQSVSKRDQKLVSKFSQKRL